LHAHYEVYGIRVNELLLNWLGEGAWSFPLPLRGWICIDNWVLGQKAGS